jgi:hypothetical protein
MGDFGENKTFFRQKTEHKRNQVKNAKKQSALDFWGEMIYTKIVL